jgi:hypothetical protein
MQGEFIIDRIRGPRREIVAVQTGGLVEKILPLGLLLTLLLRRRP